jgi:hypothetical protein
MRPPDRYSASPLPSFCTVAARPVTFAATLKAIIAWLRGGKPSRSEQQLEARLIARLVEEMNEARRREGGKRPWPT